MGQYVDQVSRETTRNLFRLVEKGVLPENIVAEGTIPAETPAETLRYRSQSVRRLITKLVRAAPPGTITSDELTPLFQLDVLTPQDHHHLMTFIDEQTPPLTSQGDEE